MDDNFFYPLRDDLRTNESVQSFMLRLTAINDYPTQNFIARDVDLLSCFQRLTPENIERLAQVSRTPADIVTPRAAMVVGKRRVSICGIMLPTQSVIQMVSRLCCACLSKDGYHRLAWNIPAVACCPFCGSQLTDTCPTCNAHLTWNRDDLLKCPEGHPLNAQLEVPASERLSRLKISRIIYEKLGEKPDWTSESDLLVSEIRETTLPEFLDLLGLLDLFEDQSQVDPSIEIIDRRLWRSAPVVERWPDAFYDKLRQAHDVRPSSNKALLFDPELGRKIYARQQTNSAKSTEIFKAATNTFIAMNNISVHNASAYADRDDRTYTIFVAATRMNVSPSRLTKMAKRLGVSFIDPGNGMTPRIRYRDFQRLRAEKKLEVVGAHKIARKLGVHVDIPVLMIKRGLFGPDAITRRLDVDNVKNFVTKDELDRFERRVQALLDAAKPSTTPRRWSGFRIKHHPASIDFVDVIDKFFKGEVRASTGEVCHLGQILFYEEDLVRLMHSREETIARSNKSSLV